MTAKDYREMVWVPGGSFRLGASEGDRLPPATNCLRATLFVKGFWLDRERGDERRLPALCQ